MSEPEYLSLADAFRRELRRQFPMREDLHHADRSTYVDAQEGKIDEPQPLFTAAYAICEFVHLEKIPLKGRAGSRTAKLAPIDSSEANPDIAYIDIFKNTLTIYSENSLSVERTYFDVHCYVEDLPIERSARRGPGPPDRYEWEEIKQFTFKQLDENGDFGLEIDQADGWRSANDLYRRIEDHLGTKKCPKQTQLKKKVPRYVEAWRTRLGR